MEVFTRLKEYEGRLQGRRRAVEQNPRDPRAAYELALLHLEFGRVTKADEVLQRVLRLDPGFAPALQKLEEIESFRDTAGESS